MRRGLVSLFCVGTLVGPIAIARAQQPAPVWPDPPGMTRPPAPAQQPQQRAPRPSPAPQAPADLQQDTDAPPAPAKKPATAAATNNIRCDGPFAKDSTHDKLAKAFGAKNVVAPPGGNASVLFPNDPKRRLEVTWHDAATRSRPATIIIEGQSAWRARGFKVGEPLTNVEKVNGKPFKLAGFEGESGGAARDWQGGALDKLSGGCLLGMRFQPDPNALQEARARVAGDGEFSSDSSDIKAVAPKIQELIVGYPP
jgi:hypothetical protein